VRVLVQWARSTATDWEEIDSNDWLALPDKGQRGRLDGERGWINAVNVQGVLFSGDALAVEPLAGNGVRVTQVNDDPADWPDTKHARVIDLYPLRADPDLGGAINTRISQVVYAEPTARAQHSAQVARTEFRDWSLFVPPAAALRRRGIWLPDPLYQAHLAAQTITGWRKWTEGVDPFELDGDQLRDQRKRGNYLVPDGTRTYYHLLSPISIPAIPAVAENLLGLAPTTATNQISSNIGMTASLEWGTTTPANEPNSAAWPTGNYRAQIDVVSANPDIEFGILVMSTANGGFLRYDSGLTAVLESKQQIEAVFALSGLHLATTGSVSWVAGAADDRFGYAIAAQKVLGHGQGQITLQLGEADDFTDGPWPAAPIVVSTNAPFYGSNF
jgi:hypothetical protein